MNKRIFQAEIQFQENPEMMMAAHGICAEAKQDFVRKTGVYVSKIRFYIKKKYPSDRVLFLY